MKIAVFLANSDHYSGGCYYAYEVTAALLALGHEVVTYSNRLPIFLDDFKYYGKFKHVLLDITDPACWQDIYADLYIGYPVHGTNIVAKLGRRFNKPAYSFIFDSLSYIKKALSYEEYQKERGYFGQIEETIKDYHLKLIGCSQWTAHGITDWVGRSSGISYLHPCINSEAIKRKVASQDDKGVLFISRLVQRKRFDELFQIADQSRHRINIVSSCFEGDALKKVTAHKNIKVYLRISDERKFGLLSKCVGVISTAMFEGFGMYAIEAYALGKPMIARDLPTFSEITGEQHRIVANTPDEMANEINSLPDRNYVPNNDYNFDKFITRLKRVISEL